jgi:hypothetical protein
MLSTQLENCSRPIGLFFKPDLNKLKQLERLFTIERDSGQLSANRQS